MKAEELFWTGKAGWSQPVADMADAQLVLYFGARDHIASGERFAELQERFPRAVVAGCSTGGQIFAGDVSDDLVAAMAFRFAATQIAVVERSLEEAPSSFAAGASLAAALARPDLKCIFVLSDGIHVNGSDLVAGLLSSAGPGVTITGGLAGDGADFAETLVGAGRPPRSKQAVAIGFYGSAIAVGSGTAGGWDEFGPKRKISKSLKNVLFTLDDEPALDLYERYLGDEAQGLPGTALLYPLLIADPAFPDHGLVRTVLGLDWEQRSMTFAGNIPQGWSAQLMYGHLDRLVEGAASAGRQVAKPGRNGSSEEVAILVSCIGRRILMGQRVVDEIAEVEANIGAGVRKIGFYSYGEISPHPLSGVCELHNETMTVTTIAEHCD